MKIAVVCI